MTASAYSLISLTHTLLPLFKENSSIVAMSFIGSERYIPHYGVMSIAKAALESAAIQLAGSLVADCSCCNSVGEQRSSSERAALVSHQHPGSTWHPSVCGVRAHGE